MNPSARPNRADLAPTPRRGLFTLALTALGAAALLTGCESQKVAPKVETTRYETLPLRKVPPVMDRTLMQLVDVVDTGPRVVSGYGLVVNLANLGDNKGDTTVPTPVREYMIKQMLKRGFGSPNLQGFQGMTPERVLRDPRVSIVKVEGYLPPGARPGQKFDVQVSVLPQNNTTSLAGGDLYLCDLKAGGANPGSPDSSVNAEASARGPIMVNPAYALESRTDDASARNSLRYGIVMGGAEVKRARPLVLRVRQPSLATSRMVERRIDLFLQDSTFAAAHDEGLVSLNVPPKYADDWEHFAGLVTHLYIDQSREFAAYKAKQLADEAQKPDAPLMDISLCWEGLGPPALPFVLPLMAHPNPDVQFAAARAAAYLDDVSAATALAQMAQTPGHPFRLNAVQTLARLPSTPRTTQILRELVDVDETLVRIEAYRALADRNDPRIYSTPLAGGRFMLDVVPGAGRPLVYATRTGTPRIALIGPQPQVALPLMFHAFDRRLTITNDPARPLVSVFYRRDKGLPPVQFLSPPAVDQLVTRLGGMGDPDAGEGFSFGYGDIVAMLQRMSDAKNPMLVVPPAPQSATPGPIAVAFVLEQSEQMRDEVLSAPEIPDLLRPPGATGQPGDVRPVGDSGNTQAPRLPEAPVIAPPAPANGRTAAPFTPAATPNQVTATSQPEGRPIR